jgi:sugar phosphate isomerase/epimerase
MLINKNKIGIMQGRLLPQEIPGLKTFPKKEWYKEFKILSEIKVKNIELIIDRNEINFNPVNSDKGRKKIKYLKKKYNVYTKSAVLDFVIHKPFFKLKEKHQNIEKKILKKTIFNLSKIKVHKIIVPLIENSKIQKKEIPIIKSFFLNLSSYLKKKKLTILFEMNNHPKFIKSFISNFPISNFGINYDTGNRYAQGYKIKDELIYSEYIKGIHIKDKDKKNQNVRLGLGCVNFRSFFSCLKKINYQGNFVLETAWPKNQKPIPEIKKNLSFLKKFK